MSIATSIRGHPRSRRRTEQWQARVAGSCDQAVQGRLVGGGPGEHGHAAGLAGELQLVEPRHSALVEEAFDADLKEVRPFR